MTADPGTSTPRRPRASRPPRSAINDRLLSAADGPAGSTLLHVEVQRNLEHLWQTGGRRGATAAGRQPEWILIRPEFIVRQPDDERGPVLTRLVPAKGLPLRMELLMLFDAQCRFNPEERVRLGRTIETVADEPYESWQKLVLADSSSDFLQAGDLRARQIKKALRVLEENHHLVRVGADKSRPHRRDYDKVTLLSEASTPESRPPYTVPATRGAVWISRHFFTNLWVFALTNTEIAVYLALAAKRASFAFTHDKVGVFAPQTTRQRQFGLKENAWRSARELHAFGLVDRLLDAGRDQSSGKITDFGARWKKHQVMPTTFTVSDTALEKPAVATIDQILNRPTFDDEVRQFYYGGLEL